MRRRHDDEQHDFSYTRWSGATTVVLATGEKVAASMTQALVRP
jgi:hypothetical protein